MEEGAAANGGGEEIPTTANVATDALTSAVADMAVGQFETMAAGAEESQAAAPVTLKYAKVGVKNETHLLLTAW